MEGQPLKDWRRTAGLVPKVWQLGDTDEDKALATLEEDTTAGIIDIRPHVDVAIQLKGLHGVLSGRK